MNFQPTTRSLVLALVLIISSSMLMHVMIFSKKQKLHYKRYTPAKNDGTQTLVNEVYVPAGDPVEGQVLAIGLDRLHLLHNGQRRTFHCPSPGQYKLGQKVRVTFNPGAPPRATRVELLDK